MHWKMHCSVSNTPDSDPRFDASRPDNKHRGRTKGKRHATTVADAAAAAATAADADTAAAKNDYNDDVKLAG